MPRLIKQRRLLEDSWHVVGVDDEIPPTGDVIVPLGVWRKQREWLRARSGSTGVWLAATDEPAEVGDFPQLIAVYFSSFTDGRGYSIARLLRQRHHFRGELRAIGDVLRDQLFELERCGFDAFVLREDQDVEAALGAFGEFSESYQSAVDTAPLFVRRLATEGKAA